MGSDEFYPEERPVHPRDRRRVLDRRASRDVADFRRFVRDTGYTTVAERPLDPAEYPDADPELLVPGSLVFRKSARAGRPRRLPQLVGVRPRRVLEEARRGRQRRSTGATATRSCRSPTRTPRRTRRGRARRCRRRRSGSMRRAAASTARASPGATTRCRTGRRMANTWQGEFPWHNPKADGFEGTSPVRASRRTATACTTCRQRLGVDDRLLHR